MNDPMKGYIPTRAEIEELGYALAYSYEAGEPPSEISPWVRYVMNEPDGGLMALQKTLENMINESETEHPTT